MEGLSEDTGLMGVSGHHQAAYLVYLGLFAQRQGRCNVGVVASESISVV